MLWLFQRVLKSQIEYLLRNASIDNESAFFVIDVYE